MSNWVSDLLDQREYVKDELWRLEQDLKRKSQELAQLKLEASGLGNAGLVVPSSVSGLSKGASAGSRALKKRKRNKQKTSWSALKREAGELQVVLSTLLVLILL